MTKIRARLLRQEFRMDSKSPLELRDTRNAFEHFEEDLDRWIVQEMSTLIVQSEDEDRYLGPQRLHDLEVMETRQAEEMSGLFQPLRRYDLTGHTIHFHRGDIGGKPNVAVDVREMMQEIGRLAEIARRLQNENMIV